MFHVLGHDRMVQAGVGRWKACWGSAEGLQRAEAGAVSPILHLGAGAGLNCPQNSAQVLFWREIVGSLCKTLQEHTISCVVHVHQEKYNKN